MTAALDGLMATGASFEAIADAATALDYRLVSKPAKPPKIGTVFIDRSGEIRRVRGRFVGWVLTVNGDSVLALSRWSRLRASGVVLEPSASEGAFSLPWLGLSLVVIARLVLAAMMAIVIHADADDLGPLWMVTALILAAATYTSVTLVHRAQWHDLALALQSMAPDWIPRLSRDVGGRVLAFYTVLGFAALSIWVELPLGVWAVLAGFLALDLLPTRHFRLAQPLANAPKVMTQAPPRRLMRRLKHLIDTDAYGLSIWHTQTPEQVLAAAEQWVREGQPWTVLGPDAEFLPGTLRSNFAWDASEIADYHFENLMELVGLSHWRTRFGGRLDYQIGPENAGLSSSEAAALQIARALAQGAETLILIDALSPLSAERQLALLDRLAAARIRVCVVSSVSDLWGRDGIDLDRT